MTVRGKTIAIVGDSHMEALGPRLRRQLTAKGARVLMAEARRGWSTARYVAARDLEMSYRRAWLLVATMNRCFQEPLVATSRRRRAGASLTARGKQVINLYRAIEARSLRSTQALSISLLRMLKP